MITNIQAAMLRPGARILVWDGNHNGGQRTYIKCRARFISVYKNGRVRLTIYQQLWSRGYFWVGIDGNEDMTIPSMPTVPTP